MTLQKSLDRRKRWILSAIIQEYIGSAEPISSRSLVEKYNLGISSATVRNEMAALEEAGFLHQPHTSAGRVPTELGYRYYVDALMERQKLSMREERSIGSLFETLNQEVEDLLRETSSLLSRLTHYTAVVVTPPKRNRARLKHLDLVFLEPNLILAVCILSDGEVAKHAIMLDRPLKVKEVRRMERFLNAELASSDLAKSRERMRAIIALEPMGPERTALERVADALPHLIKDEHQSQLFVEGTTHMLEQPDFSVDKYQHIFQALEERYRLMDLLQDLVSASQVVVKIGSELASLSSDISFVGATFQAGHSGTGTLGILGPTRMNYPRAVTAVERVAGNLSDILSAR